MPAISLTAAERSVKRGLAHHLEPVATIGNDGLTDNVVREIDGALDAHGLIKVRMFNDTRSERDAVLAQLAERLGAAPVQHIGKLFVLWRPPRPKERLAERDDRKPGPRTVKVVRPSKKAARPGTRATVRVLGNERVTAGGLVKRARPKPRSVKKASSG
jgi:RNA-binding protein